MKKASFIRSSQLLLKPAGISTGCGVLDGLIGRIETGKTYLFYGDEEVLKRLLYSIAVNAIAELDKPVLIITLRDYHRGLILDTFDLGYTAVQYYLDPEYALKNIYVAPVFNKRQAVNIAELTLLVKSLGISVILVWASTELFEYEDYPALIKFLGLLKQALENEASLILFSRASKLSKSYPPKPDGPVFLKHFASIIVYFKRSIRDEKIVKIYLVKHPYRPLKEAKAFLDYHALTDL